LDAVHGVGVEARGDACRVGGEGLCTRAARLDAATLRAVGLELEGATGHQVVGPDARLASGRAAAAVDRDAAVALPDVRLARSVGRRARDELRLVMCRPAHGVALACAV